MGERAVLLACGELHEGTPARKNFDKGRHRRLRKRIAAHKPAAATKCNAVEFLSLSKFPASKAQCQRHRTGGTRPAALRAVAQMSYILLPRLEDPVINNLSRRQFLHRSLA